MELFVVAGQHGELEEALKKAVEEIRGRVQRPDKVRLATVKIRPDAVEQVLKLVDLEAEKVPPHYRSLVNMLKRYGISQFPAVVIDGAKVGEGSLDLQALLRAVEEKARSEFPELAAIPPRAAPAPVQPLARVEPAVQPVQPAVQPERPQPPPAAPAPVLERPPAPPPPVQPAREVPRAESPREPPRLEVPPRPPAAVEPPGRVTAVVRLVLGRPDNCGECAYYGPMTARCFLFGYSVGNPAVPPCKYAGGGAKV